MGVKKSTPFFFFWPKLAKGLWGAMQIRNPWLVKMIYLWIRDIKSYPDCTPLCKKTLIFLFLLDTGICIILIKKQLKNFYIFMELLFKQFFSLSYNNRVSLQVSMQLICSAINVLNTIWKITSLIVKNMTFVFKSCGASVKI